MDLRRYDNFYFLGIKGVGMTMLAQFLHGLGKKVAGADVADVFMTDRVLKREGIRFRSGFDASYVPTDAVIVYSAAYNAGNNEEMRFIEANRKNFELPIIDYAQAIGALFNTYQGIAVCGSHGKTTTSAWLGYVLRHAGLDANVLVGARVPQFNASAVRGKSDLFVAEADEYLNKLQYMDPHGIVLTSIDYDHPDYFKTRAAYAQVFADFLSKLKKQDFLVANASDPQIRKMLATVKGKVVSYALDSKLGQSKYPVTILGHSIRHEDGWQYFRVNDFGEFKIRLLGAHNIENALAVLAAGFALGLDPRSLKKALAGFKGTARRAELIGKYRGIPVYDDYGHHPTEVKSTLQAFKEAFPKRRLVAIFHPHTFTRTKALFKDFLTCFESADVLGVLEIYGSAREIQGGISSRDLVSGLKAAGKKDRYKYLADFEEALAWIKSILKKDDLLLLIGAGDIFRVGERLLRTKGKQ